MTINDILTTYHLTQTELSRLYGIPLRTVQGWANGTRHPADWVIRLLDIALTSESR